MSNPNSDEQQHMQVNFQQVNLQSIVMVLLSLFVVVFVLKVSYNSVVPNVTKQGSLKLGKINMMQALSLMVLTGMLCCGARA